MRHWLLALPVAAVLGVCAPSSDAGLFSHGKGNGGDPCCYTLEARTVWTNEYVDETRTVTCTEYRLEKQVRKVTRYRSVPYTKEEQYTYCVLAPETRTRTETYVECSKVTEPVTRSWVVMVPTQETRQGTRRVAKTVQVVEPQTRTRDEGHWEERCVAVNAAGKHGWFGGHGLFGRLCGGGHRQGCGSGCGDPCNDCVTYVNQRVWVPKLVSYTENVTVNKCEWVDEPYTYTCWVCKPETRTETVNVCKIVPTTKTREVTYVVCVPQQKTGTRTVTCCKIEAYDAEEVCHVRVPYQVEKQVTVKVCRPVAKTVCVKVPVANPCCDSGCGRGHGLFKGFGGWGHRASGCGCGH